MSQNIDEKQNLRASVTATQKVQPPEVRGLSPDIEVGVTSDETGKPPEAPQLPPTPPPPPPVPTPTP